MRSRSGRACIALALAALALATLPSAWAGAEPPGKPGEPEERYSDFADATGFHTQRKMARAADGTLYYTYVEPAGGEGNDTDLVVVRVAPTGGEEQLPRVLAAQGNLARPSLALDAAGALHLAWTERADEDREVFAARLVGGAWADITQLSGGEGYAGFPSLAAARDGSVHVAWYGFDGTFYQTFYREWRDGAWAPATQLSSGPLDANNPSLVVADDGRVHVAWYKDEGRRYSVWYATRAPGGAWELARRLPQGDGDALNVALAIDSTGAVHAVWDERTPETTRIVHALVGATPTPIGEGEYPAIARWREGVLVVWAAPNGTLMASDLAHEARPFLAGVPGRHPSLRGPAPVDEAATLDALWAAPEDGSWEIARVALDAACSPFAPARECAPGRASPGAAVPALLAVACLAAALRRRGHDGF